MLRPLTCVALTLTAAGTGGYLLTRGEKMSVVLFPKRALDATMDGVRGPGALVAAMVPTDAVRVAGGDAAPADESAPLKTQPSAGPAATRATAKALEAAGVLVSRVDVARRPATATSLQFDGPAGEALAKRVAAALGDGAPAPEAERGLGWAQAELVLAAP